MQNTHKSQIKLLVHTILYLVSSGRLAQLARAPPLHGGCRGFESLIAHFPLFLISVSLACLFIFLVVRLRTKREKWQSVQQLQIQRNMQKSQKAQKHKTSPPSYSNPVSRAKTLCSNRPQARCKIAVFIRICCARNRQSQLRRGFYIRDAKRIELRTRNLANCAQTRANAVTRRLLGQKNRPS